MRRVLWLLPLVLIPVLLLIAGHRPDYRDLPQLPYLKTRARLDKDGQRKLFAWVRDSIESTARGESPPPAAPNVPDVGPTQVFLAVFADGRPPLVVGSDEGYLRGCFVQAARRLARHPHFERYRSDRIPLRIDLLRWRKELDVPQGDPTRATVEAGYDGLIVQTPAGPFFQPPWDILYRGWDVPDGAGRRKRRLIRQFKKLSREAGLGADGWKRAHLYRFRTNAYLQMGPSADPVELYRGNVIAPRPASATRIAAGLKGLSDWLAGNLGDDGRFRYLYDPVRDESNPSWQYGVVRHAGSVYGLYAVFNRTGDRRYLDGAERAKDYMLSIADPPLLRPDLLSVRQNRLSVLGASALGLLALCEKPAAMRTERERDAMRRLAAFLVHMQMEDGSFYTVHLQALFGIRPGHQAPYFPGETLLALTRYARELGKDGVPADPLITRTIDRAAAYQIAEFERTGKPDNWTIQALSIRATRSGKRGDRDVVYAMARYLTDRQYGIGRESPYRDYPGGFSNSRPPRSTPAASRTEATTAAWRMANFFGDPEAERLGDSILAASWFMLNQQFNETNAYYLPNPARAVGGLRGGLVDSTIRIDYNQHAMIALMGALDVLSARGADSSAGGDQRNSNP